MGDLFFGYAAFISNPDWLTGQEGEPTVQTRTMLDQTGPKRFRFEDFSFVVEIPAADWARFTPAEKQAIT